MSQESRHLRFGLTAWPDTRLPHPLSIRHDTYDLVDGVFAPRDEWREDNGPEVELGEVYLRIADLDLDDESAVMEFVNGFGVLDVRARGFRAFYRLDGFQGKVLPELQRSWPGRTRVQWEARPQDMPRGEETLAEFRFGAAWITDLASAWTVLNDDEEDRDPRKAKWVSSWWPSVTLQRSSIPRRHDLARFLVWGLDPALEPFHPRLLIDLPREESTRAEREEASLGEEASTFDWGTVPLFSICALELFNHVAERATYRRCAFCERLFVRQAGRAEQQQHRARGLKFCTRSCANAQAQRNHRQRARQEKSRSKGRMR